MTAASLRRVETAAPGATDWRVGAILRATMLGTERGLATLATGEAQVRATLTAPIPIGATLLLRVTRGGATPVLAPLSPPEPATHGASPPAIAPATGTVAAQLRSALPRQDSPATLLADLELLTTAHAPALTARPALAAAAHAFLDVVPCADDMAAPARLRKAIEQSGTFFEARLARTVTTPAASPLPDLKAAVLGLLAAMPEVVEGDRAWVGARAPPPQPHLPPGASPSALATLTAGSAPREVASNLKAGAEAALARIEVAQIGSLPDPAGSEATWLIGLPLRTPQGFDVLSLRIQRDDRSRRTDPDRPPGWSLDLAIDLAGLGPVHARVALASGVVNAALWAEDPATAALMADDIDWLAARLDDCGLGGGTLTCAQGSPPRGGWTATPPARLLDEQA